MFWPRWQWFEVSIRVGGVLLLAVAPALGWAVELAAPGAPAAEAVDGRHGMVALFVMLLVGGLAVVYWRQRQRIGIEHARLAAIVTSSADAIIGKTPDGIITDWNPGAEAMFGYTAVQAIGRTVRDLIVPPEYAAAEADLLARVGRGEFVQQLDTVRMRRDGRRLNVSVTASPIRDAQGAIVGVSTTVRDITRQKAAQELVAKSRGQFKALIRQAPISIAMFDQDMRYLAYSDLWFEQYGRGYATLIGRSHYDVHPQLPIEWKSVHRRALAGETIRNDNDSWVRADGSRQWLKWVVQPWRDEDHRIGGVIMASEDITDRRRAEEEQRIAAVAFESRDGMIVTDAHSTILKVNRAFVEITGYAAADVVGRTPAVWVSGRQDAAFYRKMWEAITREGRWEGQVWNRRKDGGVYPQWLAISSVRDEAGTVTHYVGAFSEVRDPKEAERRILDLAFYDQLTGLPNRRLMLDRLQHALAAGRRNRRLGALVMFDLDQFKGINDTLGHDAGDALLVAVAQRLRDNLRRSDSAGRLGGDEFVILLEDLDEREAAAAEAAGGIAEKLRAAIAEPFVLRGQMHHVSCSMGVTLFVGNGQGLELFLKQADLALFQAKDAGRNCVRFYRPEMQEAVDARARVETGLRRALEQEELLLHYQPQVDAGGRLIGVEALLRWQRPRQELVAPPAFIEVAEASGLIVPIGARVLELACRQLGEWAAVPATRDLMVAVNISPRQFRHGQIVEQLSGVLERSGANPRLLRLELTESHFLHDVEGVIGVMRRLKEIGVTISIDDFGTGYSSLSLIKRLPLDELKIANDFVQHIETDADYRAIVRTILTLGESFNLRVVVEGVETEAQHDVLAAMGCKAYQGYLFGRPGPGAEVAGLAERVG